AVSNISLQEEDHRLSVLQAVWILSESHMPDLTGLYFLVFSASLKSPPFCSKDGNHDFCSAKKRSKFPVYSIHRVSIKLKIPKIKRYTKRFMVKSDLSHFSNNSLTIENCYCSLWYKVYIKCPINRIVIHNY